MTRKVSASALESSEVILGSENSNWVALSKSAPARRTSAVLPICAPGGNTVHKRARGKSARALDASRSAKASPKAERRSPKCKARSAKLDESEVAGPGSGVGDRGFTTREV